MRRKSSLQDLDTSVWPSVAYTELAEDKREAFQRRMHAVERYVQGDSIHDIEAATGINRRQLYRLIERCLAEHEDGRIYGFRALATYARIASYKRVTKITGQGERGSGRSVGALRQLLERYPTLASWLR